MSTLVSYFRSLAACASQLVRAWWRQDRIRIARTSGVLLTLEPGARLLIQDVVYLVVERNLRFCQVDHVEVTEPIAQAVEYALREEAASNSGSPALPEFELAMTHSDSLQPASLIVPLAYETSLVRFKTGRYEWQEILGDECLILPSVARASMLSTSTRPLWD